MSGIRYLNGLGLVASNQRSIRDGKEFDKYFKAPLRSDPFLTYAGNTHDTINFMSDIIKNTTSDTKGIAPVLRGSNKSETLKKIFDFIFQHIQYKPDKPTEEELRRPIRSWADRTTGVDCDCYSILIGSILSNLRIPFALRMVKINGKAHFQHVYVVVPKSGKQSDLNNRNGYYVVDPVLDTYNEEHPFTEKYDLFMQPIRYLNGTTLQGLQGGNPLSHSGYYSHEAALTPETNVTFFDGVDYYERDEELASLSGLNGVQGLGFLKKIFSIAKKAIPFIKRIAKKAIKKVKFKKGANGERTERRGVFSMRRDENGELNERVQARRARRDERRLAEPVQQPVQQASQSLSANDVISTVKALDKGMGMDSIINLIDKTSVDKDLMTDLVQAKIDANKGITSEEARIIAKQTADAEKSDITKDIMASMDRINKAGFGGMSLQTIALILVGGGFLFQQFKNNRVQAAPAVAS